MKRSVTFSLLITAIGILLSACGSVQSVRRTITVTERSASILQTPSLTLTSSPTPTPPPTNTPTQTSTPTPIPILVENAKSLIPLRVIGQKVEGWYSQCPMNVSPNLKYYVHYTDLNYELREMQTGQLVSPKRPSCYSAAFSPDEKYLAMGDYSIEILDTHTGEVKYSMDAGDVIILFLAFSPDSQTLLSLSFNRLSHDVSKISLWDASDGKLIGSTTCKGGCFLATFSPDGKTLAINSADVSGDKIILLDALTLKPIRTVAKRLLYLKDLLFSPDGKILAAVDQWQTVLLWDVESGNLIGSFTPRCFDPTGKDQSITRCVSLNEDEWSLARGNDSMAFSPDGKILAIGYDKGSIILWNVMTTQPLFVYKPPLLPERKIEGIYRSSIRFLVFSKDGTILSSSNLDNTITLWGFP
jgi:WD40 repeat protein